MVTVFTFVGTDNDKVIAYTLNANGDNLPVNDSAGKWKFSTELLSDPNFNNPPHIQEMFAGIHAKGYHLTGE